ncbi:alpha/beta hydrolase [[Eubacterium] cellulosolvens]
MGELYQDPVTFESQGERVTGLLHIPDKDRPPAVVMCHGWTGNLHGHGLFVECAQRLCNAGFMVLRFDFRGSEHSEGRFQEMTIGGEVNDLKRALHYIRERKCDPHRIGVLGYSLGSLVSLLGWEKSVKVMVLWSSTLNPKEVFTKIIGEKRLQEITSKGYSMYQKDFSPYRTLRRFMIGKPFFDEISKICIREKIDSVACPVSIIHGDKDDIVDISQSKELYQTLHEPKEFTIIKGADHYFNTKDQRMKLYSSTLNYFIRWLKD